MLISENPEMRQEQRHIMLIQIISVGLSREDTQSLRENAQSIPGMLFEHYSRDSSDTALPSQMTGSVVIIGNARTHPEILEYRDRPATEIILTDPGPSKPPESGNIQWLDQTLEPAALNRCLSIAARRLEEAASQSLDDTTRAPGMQVIGADGVVIVDNHNHILFTDHIAKSIGSKKLLRLIEAVSADDYPIAGTVYGQLPLPNTEGSALTLDARRVQYGGYGISVICIHPVETIADAETGVVTTTEDITGLISRDSLYETLGHYVTAPEHAHDVLLVIDLDRMKVLTEGVGHHASDHAIAVAAARLHSLTRSSDLLARVGNDEFALLLRGAVSDEQVEKITASLLEDIAQPVRLTDSSPLHLTASIGSARLEQAEGDVSRLMRQADIALAHARESGGNRYVAYSASFSDTLRRRWDMETKLREAIQREQFHLEFQPLIQSGTNAVVAAESLLRWNDPTHGRVYPDQFIPLLEETGLIVPLGEWIILEACRKAKAWQEAGSTGFRISVNVSPIQVEEPGLLKAVRKALDESGLAPEFLVLEITERLLLEYTERAHEVLDNIAALGVKIFLDDFGTGYSSLGYLKRFPVCGIKIDRSFIDALPDGKDDRAISLAILDLCKHMDLWAIPEGVETAAQAAFLTENGATLQQGFFYSKPVPADDFAMLLKPEKATRH